MKRTRSLVLAVALSAALPANAATEDQDWTAFGHMLTLIQAAVRAGTNPNPDQAMADLLSGRNAEANGAIASLFEGATADMPQQYRDRVASIGRDLAGYAASHPATSLATRGAGSISVERSLQARKDLTAMGLHYYDHGEFLDAVKRNDQLAVELFIAGRGVDVAKRAWTGRSALDIARDNGNTQLAELISRSLPPAR